MKSGDNWSTHLGTSASFVHSISAVRYEQECAELYRAAHELGLTVFKVDCDHLKTRGGVWDEFARVLDFPSWFGRNWDGLSDLLRDLSWFNTRGFLVLLLNEDSLAKEDPEHLRKLARVLERAVSYWQAGESETGPFPNPIAFHLVGVSATNSHPLLSRI